MNPYTGEVRNVTTPEEEEQAKADGFTIGVKRDLSLVERVNRQIMLYQPCGCGSGVNFKFCCHMQPNAKLRRGNPTRR